MAHELSSVQGRLRHFREGILGLSLRELQSAVNAGLPAEERVSLGTVSNYERSPEPGRRSAGPRAEFLGALKRAFPRLRLPWLLLGEGEPTLVGDGVAAVARRVERDGGLAGRVVETYQDLELLSPEASALFIAVLTRYAMGEPEMALGEKELLELAADLRWLLLLPFGLWGFEHHPDYDRFSAYSVAMLHALSLALPAASGGDPIAAYAESPIRALKAEVSVGFGGGPGHP